MAGYIGTQAVSVNTTSATISDDLSVGDDLTVTDDATIGGTALVTGVLTTTAAAVFSGGFTSNGDTVTFTSANATDPLLIIQNTTNDAASARIRFVKDKGAAGADDDNIGTIEFFSDNAAQEQTQFALIRAEVAISNDGAEGGKLRLQVATHDGEMQSGLILADGNAEDEIDVQIAKGTSSLTTIAGNATVSGSTLKIVDTELSEVSDNFSINIQSGNNDFLVKSGGTTFAAFKGQSGNLLVGATSVFGASRATIQCASGDQALSLKTEKTTGSEAILLFADGDNDTCGNITINTGSQQAALANGSDYRLKTDVQPMTGASTRVQALNPVNFEWLSDGSRIDGFLAHEAQAVVPDAVFGTHNATKTLTNVVISSSNRVLSENIEQSDWTAGKSATTDEDGNAVAAIYPSNSTWAAEHVVPEMQMMDHTKMIPLLVASLQEALTRIETLEAKVAVLEG